MTDADDRTTPCKKQPKSRRPLSSLQLGKVQSNLCTPQKQFAANPAKVVAHKSGLQLFHKIKAKRGGFSAANKQFWAKTREEWNALAEDEQLKYAQQVEDERATAKSGAALERLSLCQDADPPALSPGQAHQSSIGQPVACSSFVPGSRGGSLHLGS